jgi:CrcB protein
MTPVTNVVGCCRAAGSVFQSLRKADAANGHPESRVQTTIRKSFKHERNWNPAVPNRRDAQSAEQGYKPVMYLWIIVGSAIGGGLRYFFSGLVAAQFGETFPWGTLFVNVTGSFVIGFFATLTAPDGRIIASPVTRQFVTTGICGGYTTFSSFSLQTLNLVRDDEWLYAGGNAVLSVALCMVFVWAGHVAATAINQMKGV